MIINVTYLGTIANSKRILNYQYDLIFHKLDSPHSGYQMTKIKSIMSLIIIMTKKLKTLQDKAGKFESYKKFR